MAAGLIIRSGIAPGEPIGNFVTRGLWSSIPTPGAAYQVRFAPDFRIRLFRPAPSDTPLDDLWIDPKVTSLVFGTGLPGGFTSCEIGLPTEKQPSGVLPRRVQIMPHARLQVWHGAALLFEGRVMGGYGPFGMFGFRAIGYGLTALNDDYYESTDTTLMTTLGVLRGVLAQSAPLIQLGGSQEAVDPQIDHAPAEMTLRPPSAIIEQLTSEGGVGDLGNVVYDATVWGRRVMRYLPRSAPATPDYIIPYDGQPYIDWVESYDNMYSEANVRYTLNNAELETGRSSTDGFYAEYEFTRAQLLSVGDMTASGAATYLSTWLAMHAAPERSIVVMRNSTRGLERGDGSQRAPYLVRAGEWVQIALGMPDDPLLPIVATTYDAFTGEGTFELGMPNVLDDAENLAEVCRELGAVNQWRHPQTGTRTRSGNRRKIDAGSGTVTVTADQSGRTFTATAAATYNLPSPTDGLEYTFFQTTDNNLAITATGDIIIVANDTCTTVTWQTSNEKKGAGATVLCDGTNWILFNHSPEAYTMTLS